MWTFLLSLWEPFSRLPFAIHFGALHPRITVSIINRGTRQLRHWVFLHWDRAFQTTHLLFLYLLYIVSKLVPNIATITAVKLPSILCDFICAWYVYRIVKLKYEKGPIPVFAFLAILFAPTVILNSAVWGQADSIFTAALVAFLYHVLKKTTLVSVYCLWNRVCDQASNHLPGSLFVGIVIEEGRVMETSAGHSCRLSDPIIPAWIAGRPLGELLTVYFDQVQGVPGLFHNVPNMYTWLPADDYGPFFVAGIIFAVSISLIYAAVVYKSRVSLSKQLLVQLAFVSALLVPFFLPKTHDRYFYLSDILSIVFAFYFPEYFYVGLAANLISFFVYTPYLFGMDIFPQTVWRLPYLR